MEKSNKYTTKEIFELFKKWSREQEDTPLIEMYFWDFIEWVEKNENNKT